MIRAGELRIGNYYIDICGEINRWELDFYQYYKALPLTGENGYEIINPIELTPEILEKCGFENNRIFKETITIEVDLGYQTEFGYAVFIEQYSDGVTVRIIIPGWIKYLHQLQNLYFVLTGEELNVQI